MLTMRKKSLELQYLETLAQRTKLSFAEQQQLVADQKGFQGESAVDYLTQAILPTQTEMMDDVNLCVDGKRVQIDKLIQVGRKLYLIDMKNYHGRYSFRNRTWYHNGKPLTHSIFSQIERAHDILARIFAEHHLVIEVVKVIVFTNPTAVIEVDDHAGIIVKYLWEYCDWLQKLCHEEEAANLSWKKVLQNYCVAPYRPVEDFSVDSRKIWQGICCPKCGNFWWQQERFALQCKICGYREAKETAYVRTICDYGTLYFRQNLRLSEVTQFFGNGYNRRYLAYTLKKHFIPLNFKGKQFAYRNPGETFEFSFKNQQRNFKQLEQRVNWKCSPRNNN